MKQQGILIIFSKSPEPGEVKTRLIPQIGVRKTTDLYKELLARTIKTATNARFSEIQLWIDGNPDNDYLIQLGKSFGIKIYQQEGNELGKRMSNAFDRVLEKYTYAVLIGCDCPSMTTSDLCMASEYLMDNTDIVLGPAKDGGYYLIGLKKNNQKIFENIKWGKSTVFEKTCEQLNKLNWSLSLLPERWDLDRVSDLHDYYNLKQNNIPI